MMWGRVGHQVASRRVLGMGSCVAAFMALGGCGGADLLQTAGLGPSKPTLNVTPRSEAPPREISPGEAKAARATLGEAAVLAAARSNPADLDAVVAAARIMRGQGDKPGALALLDTSAPVAPNDARLLRERGLLALELGALARARDHLKKAVENGSGDWQTLSALGAALAAGGDQKSAQRQFAEALKQAPDNPIVLNNLALSLALEGKRGEAEQMLRQAAGHKKGADGRVAQNLALVSGIGEKGGKAAAKPAEPTAAKPSTQPLAEAKDAGRDASRDAKKAEAANALRTAEALP